mmetsp:Transcript_17452/g.43460  ORF Transcript_17452/g.43460 Transcript_17452/m.43460 type:complete len:243 (-) Transcript_17452:1918-2646(-)
MKLSFALASPFSRMQAPMNSSTPSSGSSPSPCDWPSTSNSSVTSGYSICATRSWSFTWSSSITSINSGREMVPESSASRARKIWPSLASAIWSSLSWTSSLYSRCSCDVMIALVTICATNTFSMPNRAKAMNRRKMIMMPMPCASAVARDMRSTTACSRDMRPRKELNPQTTWPKYCLMSVPDIFLYSSETSTSCARVDVTSKVHMYVIRVISKRHHIAALKTVTKSKAPVPLSTIAFIFGD